MKCTYKKCNDGLTDEFMLTFLKDVNKFQALINSGNKFQSDAKRF